MGDLSTNTQNLLPIVVEYNNKIFIIILTKDIYLDPSYLKLFEGINDGVFCDFTFSKGLKKAFYPFLMNSVNDLGYELNKEYNDIQGAYGYNGVLTNSFDPRFIDEFYHAFDVYCTQNNIIAEFTRFNPLLGNQTFSRNKMDIILDRETVALNLNQNYDLIWTKEYSSKNRNMVRKAQKLGYSTQVMINPSLAEIDQFVAIYHYTMKMVSAEKYYFFNKEFFKNTFASLKDHAILFNIYNIENEVVCSSIFFLYNDHFHYHLSGRTANADNSVNNFLLDEAVKFAQSKGAKIFHLGGGHSSAPDDSLLKFKSNFSKTRLPFYIGKKIHDQEAYDEVVRQWQEKFPEKKEKFKNHLLKYRY